MRDEAGTGSGNRCRLRFRRSVGDPRARDWLSILPRPRVDGIDFSAAFKSPKIKGAVYHTLSVYIQYERKFIATFCRRAIVSVSLGVGVYLS